MENPKIFKDLHVYESLNNIILENGAKVYKQSPYVILKKETVSFIREFLKSDETLYDKIFDQLDKEKRIKFSKNWINKFDKKKQIINVNYTKTIEDVFNLIYSFYDYMSNSENNSDLKKLFSKVIPNTEEGRICAYLKNLGYKQEANRHINNNFYDFYETAKNAKMELELYKIYSKTHNIDDGKLPADLYNYNQDRIFFGNASVDKFGEYIFGFIMSVYINHRLNNNEMCKKDYLILRNNIDKLTINDISDILGIKFDMNPGLFIPDSDIDKLSKVYRIEFNKCDEK